MYFKNMQVERYTLVQFYSGNCTLIPELTELILIYAGVLRYGSHSIQWIIYL